MKNNDIKKYRKIASALKYDKETDNAPHIVAMGKGNTAEKMIKMAEDNGVQVVENKSLATMLQKQNIGDEIPEELYQVVAEILVFVSEADNEFK